MIKQEKKESLVANDKYALELMIGFAENGADAVKEALEEHGYHLEIEPEVKGAEEQEPVKLDKQAAKKAIIPSA